MGGSTFARKGIDTVRLPLDDYEAVAGRVLSGLQNLAPDLIPARVVPHYRTKLTFGDLDVIVDRRLMERFSREAISEALDALAWSNGGKNDPVLSLALETPAGPFQIDLVTSDPNRFDYALRYMSWGDAGSLASAIGRQMGLKHGQTGLRLYFDEPGHRFDVHLSSDYDEALQFLGLDPAAHRAGFDTPEQVYRWIAASPYYDPAIFQIERLTNDAKHRVKRRSFYSDFLEWMKGVPARYQWGERDARRAEWYPIVLERFPHAAALVEAARAERQAQRRVEFLTGDIVSEVSGETGLRLSHLINAVRKEIGDGLDDMQARAGHDELADVIRRVAATNFMPLKVVVAQVTGEKGPRLSFLTARVRETLGDRLSALLRRDAQNALAGEILRIHAETVFPKRMTL